MATMQTMRQFRTEQERIDEMTMKIENPNVVGSGYIAHPPQRPFQQPVMVQPPTVAHMEYPEEFAGYNAAPRAAPANVPARKAPVTYVAPTYTTRPAGTPSHTAAQPRPAASQSAYGNQRSAYTTSQPGANTSHAAHHSGAGPVSGTRPMQSVTSSAPAAVPRPQVQQNHQIAPRANPAVPNRGYAQPQPSQRPQPQAYAPTQPARPAPAHAPRGYNAPAQPVRPTAVQQRPMTTPGGSAVAQQRPQSHDQSRMYAPAAAPHGVPRPVHQAAAARPVQPAAAARPVQSAGGRPMHQPVPAARPVQPAAAAHGQAYRGAPQPQHQPAVPQRAAVPPVSQSRPVQSVPAAAPVPKHVESAPHDDDDDETVDGSKLTKGQAKRLRKKKREAAMKQGI